ncbi:MAG TPA: PH domain-containing protein [Streptosporangiaceae bacterium]|nr:PH domain-containing protein [Streptosporangiaceae bacterium]
MSEVAITSSTRHDRSTERQVYRTTGSVILWWAWLVFAAASLVALTLAGHGRGAVVTAVVLVAVTGVAYACALRPRIIAGPDGITVVNPLREHTLPWAAVTRVDLTDAVRVHYRPTVMADREKIVHSWAVQSPRRARAIRQTRARRTALRAPRVPDPHGAGGYGRPPQAVNAALAGTMAEFAARHLGERADLEQHRKDAASHAVAVRWTWWPIAGMVIPILALIAVVLA